jgi:hypothetical protein
MGILLFLPTVHAAEFVASLEFADLQTAASLAVVSGDTEVQARTGDAPTILASVDRFSIHGVEVACWESPCLKGDLSVRVGQGSTLALRFPKTGDLRLDAPAAMSMAVDLDAVWENLGGMAAGFTLAPGLATGTSNGQLRFERQVLAPEPDGPIPAASPIPGLPGPVASQFMAPDPTDANAAVLATITPQSSLEILQGGSVVQVLHNASALLLQGNLDIETIRADSFVIPCAQRCDVVVTANASDRDITAAVDNVLSLVGELQGEELEPIDWGFFDGMLNAVADGAYVVFPLDVKKFEVGNLTLVRFSRLEASLGPQDQQATGSGGLVIQSGEVRDAPPFVGTRFFAMPSWSYLLWGLAVVALVVRVIVRRKQEQPERGWLNRLVGLGSVLALAVAWHLVFVATFGIGMTTPGLEWQARGMMAAVEALTLLGMVLILVVPLTLLLRNTLRLVGLPKVASYAPTMARLAGIALGGPLLLGLIHFALGLAG